MKWPRSATDGYSFVFIRVNSWLECSKQIYGVHWWMRLRRDPPTPTSLRVKLRRVERLRRAGTDRDEFSRRRWSSRLSCEASDSDDVFAHASHNHKRQRTLRLSRQ